MQYQWIILISNCWKFSFKTYLYTALDFLYLDLIDFLSNQLFLAWFQVGDHFFRCTTINEISEEIKKSVRVAHAVQMSHFYIRLIVEYFLFRLIHTALTYLYCMNLFYIVWLSECCLTFQWCNFSLLHFILITVSVKVF